MSYTICVRTLYTNSCRTVLFAGYVLMLMVYFLCLKWIYIDRITHYFLTKIFISDRWNNFSDQQFVVSESTYVFSVVCRIAYTQFILLIKKVHKFQHIFYLAAHIQVFIGFTQDFLDRCFDWTIFEFKTFIFCKCGLNTII